MCKSSSMWRRRGLADKTLGTVHGDGPDGVLPQVLGNLQDELGGPVLDNKSVEDLRKSIFKLDVNDGTNDRDNLSLGEGSSGGRAYGEVSSLSNGCCWEDTRDISSFGSLLDQTGSGTSCCAQHFL